jgi:uncharacterized lipoprotein YmbA
MKRSLLTSATTHTMLVAFVLLSGCVGTPAPDTQYYLLRADNAPAAVLPLSNVHLSKVVIAPYLDQAGLVLEHQPGTIAIARYHQWSEPLSFSLKNFLSQTLSTRYGQEIRTGTKGLGVGQGQQGKALEVTIDQLHGTVEGDVKLVASWTLQGREASPAPITYHKFSRTLPLSKDGYAALVQAQKQLLTELAQAIAETLP